MVEKLITYTHKKKKKKEEEKKRKGWWNGSRCRP
jgi:hypothetical protein